MRKTEFEKLKAGEEYCYNDPEVAGYKIAAVRKCMALNAIDPTDRVAQEAALRDLFGSAGRNPCVFPVFSCDFGFNIRVGDDFLANYNVTVLDIAPVTMGDNVMIGPNTLITSVGHPLSPERRRDHVASAKPVTIGDDVWIGGNCTILPGVTIGDGAVVAAGAVVSRDVPARTVAAGVPARVMKGVDPLREGSSAPLRG